MSNSKSSDFKEFKVNTIEFWIPNEYDFVEYLSGGTYGNVIKVQDKEKGIYAVKKMHDPFSDNIRARRLYRELKLLELMDHENVIHFHSIYTPDLDYNSFRNVFIVTQYAGMSLRYVLDKQKMDRKKLLNHDHIKYIIYQLLRALKYLHSAHVIHRDLKPSNLAITEECDLTVLDFGLARTVSTTSDNLTAYVISRWYRSPEVIFWNNVSYNEKADIWSVGCILAELLSGRVLFPGSGEMEQYRLIINLCGSPSEELMSKIEAQTNSSMRMIIERLGGDCERKDFNTYFKDLPPEAIDLLNSILVMDPDKRISVEEALRHAYMKEYYMPSDEPTANQPFNIDDNASNDVDYWKKAIWDEIHRLKHSPESTLMDTS